MPERGVDTAPLTFYLSEESRVGLLHTPTRVPLSLSLSLSRSSSRFLSLSFSLLLSPISLSLSLGLQRQINVSPLFSFSEWRMQNACNRMRLSLLPPPPFSLPDLSKKGNFRYRSNLCGSPRDRGGILARDDERG